jgi:cyclic beta-1,2-glucan synthetase
MAHHQGMSLVALTNCLLGNPMPRRFRAEPMVRATELLLQERMPRSAPLVDIREEETPGRTPQTASVEGVGPVSRRLTTAATPGPRTHLLSNGRYTVMVTNAGAGFSTCRRSGGLGGPGSSGINLDVTRWREDYTRDAWGQFFYIRDLESGLIWSAGHQPVCRAAEEYEVVYSADKADFRRVDNGIAADLEITVAPEQNAEVRRLTLTNRNSRACDLEVTSYAEVVLAPHSERVSGVKGQVPGKDKEAGAFLSLTPALETEWVPVHQALLCCRRPACGQEQPVWAVHVFAAEGLAPLPLCTPEQLPCGSGHAAGQGAGDEIQFETDRARFLGRGRTPANPAALDPGVDLSGTTGPMLDPIFSLRKRVRLAPGASVTLAFSTAVAGNREEALALAGHYRDPHAVLRAFELAWTHSQVELRHHQMHSGDTHLYQRLATHLLLAGPLLRGASAERGSGRVPDACAQRPACQWGARRLEQSGLWRHGIGRDRPLALVTLGELEHLVLIRQLLAAHAYWHLRGLEVDLVILNEQPPGHLEELQPALQHLIRNSDARALVDKPGGIFLLEADQVGEDRQLLQALARIVLKADCGPLARQLESTEMPAVLPALLIPQERALQATEGAADLHLANGGGFTPDGREYVFCPVQRVGGAGLSRPDANPVPPCLPPAPWVNVVANRSLGFLISETGSGFTWAGDSQTNRLTPWYQDPVSDPPGEVVYLRDEITGAVWTPTPLPLGMGFPTRVRHGQGHTVFEQQGPGLAVRLTLFVPPEAPVKVIALKIRNQTGQVRHLSATFYAEWVLGTVREQAPMRVLTELDPVSGALLARNPFNEDFATRVAFANISLRPRTLTADRTEFLGRNGSTASPAALRRVCLSGRVGARLDPCAALHALFELRPEEEKQLVFLLGAAPDLERARQYATQYQGADQVERALSQVKGQCDRMVRLDDAPPGRAG